MELPMDHQQLNCPAGFPVPGNGRYDVMSYRMVVGSLGLCVILAGGGMVLLAMVGKETPASLTALGAAALGALSSFLIPGK